MVIWHGCWDTYRRANAGRTVTITAKPVTVSHVRARASLDSKGGRDGAVDRRDESDNSYNER